MSRWSRRIRLRLAALVCAGAAFAAGAEAGAAEVTIEVSTRQTWVGIPFIVRVTVSDADQLRDPAFPEVEGLELLGPPHRAQQSMTTIVGGRMRSKKSVTLSWSVVATRAGQFRIPPLAVEADGEIYESRPIDISAQESEARDDVRVELIADRDRYYLGERIPLMLEVWLKPFTDPESGRTLDARTMMGRIQARKSNWGVFADDIDDVSIREDDRPDEDGVPTRFIVVTLEGVHTPPVPGPITLDDVRILVDYPESLTTRRNFFGRTTVEIDRSRPVVVAPPPAAITIQPLPEIGRPPTFTGAVGQFDFEASASATEVTVGDPIELTMTVVDRTDTGGRLDVLQAPALHLDAALTESFRVPEESIPGVVSGSRKSFAQTIRATTDSVDEIPPISFAYFDPAEGRYAIATSTPIPLSVAPATAVSLTEVVTAPQAGAAGSSAGKGTTLTAVSGGIIAAYDDMDVLLVTGRPRFGAGFGAMLVAPPMAWAVCALVRWRRRRHRDDPAAVRRRGARSTALRRLHAVDDASAVAAALRGYVADRSGLTEGAVTASEAISRLGRCGVNGGVLEQVKSLLDDCDQAVYAGGDARGDLAERAQACISRLEKERIR